MVVSRFINLSTGKSKKDSKFQIKWMEGKKKKSIIFVHIYPDKVAEHLNKIYNYNDANSRKILLKKSQPFDWYLTRRRAYIILSAIRTRRLCKLIYNLQQQSSSDSSSDSILSSSYMYSYSYSD